MTRMLKLLALATLLSACSLSPTATTRQDSFDLRAWLESQRGKAREAADWPNSETTTTDGQ